MEEEKDEVEALLKKMKPKEQQDTDPTSWEFNLNLIYITFTIYRNTLSNNSNVKIYST